MFHFKVTIEVTHNDRDIEFIQFKRWLESLYANGAMEADFKSCEMLGEELIRAISGRYPNRDMQIEVFEDDENGAILKYTKA
jgi:hypothetical protein